MKAKSIMHLVKVEFKASNKLVVFSSCGPVLRAEESLVPFALEYRPYSICEMLMDVFFIYHYP